MARREPRARLRPAVRIINDAALQALASYEGGRMLFVGFGTSIGSALVADDTIVPVELGLIPFTKRATFKTRLTKEARKKSGHKRWQKYVHESVALLQDIFWPSDTVIGGGNAKHLDPLPDHCRRTTNRDAFVGARRLWGGKRPPRLALRDDVAHHQGGCGRPDFFLRKWALGPRRSAIPRPGVHSGSRIEPMPIDIALTGLAMPLAEFPGARPRGRRSRLSHRLGG